MLMPRDAFCESFARLCLGAAYRVLHQRGLGTCSLEARSVACSSTHVGRVVVVVTPHAAAPVGTECCTLATRACYPVVYNCTPGRGLLSVFLLPLPGGRIAVALGLLPAAFRAGSSFLSFAYLLFGLVPAEGGARLRRICEGVAFILSRRNSFGLLGGWTPPSHVHARHPLHHGSINKHARSIAVPGVVATVLLSLL